MKAQTTPQAPIRYYKAATPPPTRRERLADIKRAVKFLGSRVAELFTLCAGLALALAILAMA